MCLTNTYSVGVFIKTRGVKGELVLELQEVCRFDDIKESVFVEIDGLLVPFFVEQNKPISTNRTRITLRHIADEQKAKEIIDCKVFVKNNELNNSTINIQTALLEGFTVVDKKHGNIGRVQQLLKQKNNPLIIIKHKQAEILIPYQENIIKKIDVAEQIIYVETPEGLINIYL